MSTEQALEIFDGNDFHTWQVKIKGYLMKGPKGGVYKSDAHE